MEIDLDSPFYKLCVDSFFKEINDNSKNNLAQFCKEEL